jgi:hypothetical protein
MQIAIIDTRIAVYASRLGKNIKTPVSFELQPPISSFPLTVFSATTGFVSGKEEVIANIWNEAKSQDSRES